LSDEIDRRHLLKLGCTAAAVAVLPAACSKSDPPKPNPAPSSSASAAAPVVAVDTSVVRVGSVPTAVEGKLLPTLIADFERTSKRKVILTASEGVYDLARSGQVDLVISHYGHKHAEAFVMDGLGEFPRTLFSNQMALVGPPADPAKVRGLADAGLAFRRIAETKSPFVVNDIDGVRYLVEILWNAAGRPKKDGWYIDEGQRKDDAILAASDRGAYSLWGLTPFLRLDSSVHLKLAPLVLADPLLQRMLVSIVVRPSAKTAGVNVEGAHALENHFLAPATQAQIREVRYPGATEVCWVPAGRHNRTGVLPHS
jgi:tungstate transport system substrate-binding protein